MEKGLMRLLAAVLALLLALGSLCFAGAEDDWREQLRKLYGLTDEAQTDPQDEAQTERQSESKSASEDAFQLPVTDPPANRQLPGAVRQASGELHHQEGGPGPGLGQLVQLRGRGRPGQEHRRRPPR